jgi:hypothetical protein
MFTAGQEQQEAAKQKHDGTHPQIDVGRCERRAAGWIQNSRNGQDDSNGSEEESCG